MRAAAGQGRARGGDPHAGDGWTFAKLTIANAALRELAAEAASGRKRRAG